MQLPISAWLHIKLPIPGRIPPDAKVGERIDITRGYGSFTLQNEYEKASGSLKIFYNFGEHDITDGFHSLDDNYGVNLYESLHLFEGKLNYCRN
jgi:hypothetical protein